MIEGGKTFSESASISEKDLQETRHIRAFKDLPSAGAAFDAALAKITPDIRSQNLRSSLQRSEAIHKASRKLDCFAGLAMTKIKKIEKKTWPNPQDASFWFLARSASPSA